MLTAVAFPEWTPDLTGNVLSRAVNVVAVANGYAPVRGPQVITTPQGGDLFLGGSAFIDSTGATTLLAAQEGGVSKLNPGLGSGWAAVISASLTHRVGFAQFGDNVILSFGPDLTIRRHSLTGVGGAPTAAFNAIDVARVRDFVMAITTDNKVRWSKFNNVSDWTTGSDQADEQPILDSFGVRLIGGEYGILLKKQGITRITYVGSANDVIFQFDEIAPEIGCMADGSVCNVGRLIFFLSERGFEMCDGSTVTPIADEKFNRWFFDRFSRADIANIWAAIDPRNSLVLWGMPGTPGLLIAYNWVLKRATTIQCSFKGIFTGYSTAVGIEDLDAEYGDLDSVPVSLDDASLAGGNPMLLLANENNEMATLNGETLEAVWRLDNVEPAPGKRSRIRGLRLVTDATDASVTLNSRMRIGDAEGIETTSTMRSNGKLPIRANGRYHNLEAVIPAEATWSFAQGCEIEFEPGDGR